MTEEILRMKLAQPENPWVEKKESLQDDRVLKTLVGFANSVPHGAEPAVIFLGASDKGDHPGLRNVDEAQKTITALVTARAYPAIEVSMRLLPMQISGESKDILAVIIPPSSRKPHFSGSAWIRQGSETRRATEDIYEDLIASRHDNVRVLQKYKGAKVILGLFSAPTGLRIDFWNAKLFNLNAKTVEVDTNEGGYFPFAVDSISVFHQLTNLPRINAPSPWTEQEQIKKMIARWASGNPEGNLTNLTRTTELSDQLLANLRVTLDQIRWAAKQTPSQALRSLRATADLMARESKIG